MSLHAPRVSSYSWEKASGLRSWSYTLELESEVAVSCQIWVW